MRAVALRGGQVTGISWKARRSPSTGSRLSRLARSIRSTAPVSVELPSMRRACSSPMVKLPSSHSVARMCACTLEISNGTNARL